MCFRQSSLARLAVAVLTLLVFRTSESSAQPHRPDPPSLHPPVITSTSATLTWVSVLDGDFSVELFSDPGRHDRDRVFSGPTHGTSITIEGLLSDKTYHYDISVRVSNRASIDARGSFRTLAGPPTHLGSGGADNPEPPTPLAASQITSNSASLSWSGGGPRYDVQVAGSARYATVNNSPFAATSLLPNTTYDWQVRSRRGNDTSAWVQGPSFTTLRTQPPPPQPPPSASGLKAVPTASGVTLSWTSSAGAVSYRIQVSTKSNFPPGQTDQDVTTPDTTLAVGGLSGQTTYYWRVSASSSAGTSGWSTASFTTLALQQAPAQPPASPTGLSATPTTASATLKWNSSMGAVSYQVEVSTKDNFPPGKMVEDMTISDTTANIGGLSTQTTYYWRVNASNGSGASAWSEASFATQSSAPPPGAPTGLTATATTTGATLDWSSVTGATLYRIQVSTHSNFPPGQIVQDVTTSRTSTTVSGLSSQTTYYWRVNASNADGTSGWSSSSFATEQGTTAADEVVSNVPSEFELSQNYPNPFNPSTTIQFSLSKSSHVKILIYSTLGHLVHTLVDEALPPGTYRKQWVATGMMSGIYFYRIQAGGFFETKRLVLIK